MSLEPNTTVKHRLGAGREGEIIATIRTRLPLDNIFKLNRAFKLPSQPCEFLDEDSKVENPVICSLRVGETHAWGKNLLPGQ